MHCSTDYFLQCRSCQWFFPAVQIKIHARLPFQIQPFPLYFPFPSKNKYDFRTQKRQALHSPLCCRTFQKCDPRNARFRLHPYKESVPGYHKYKYPRPLFPHNIQAQTLQIPYQYQISESGHPTLHKYHPAIPDNYLHPG